MYISNEQKCTIGLGASHGQDTTTQCTQCRLLSGAHKGDEKDMTENCRPVPPKKKAGGQAGRHCPLSEAGRIRRFRSATVITGMTFRRARTTSVVVFGTGCGILCTNGPSRKQGDQPNRASLIPKARLTAAGSVCVVDGHVLIQA